MILYYSIIIFKLIIFKINKFSNINIIPDEDTSYSYIWSKLKILDASQYYPTVATKLSFMVIELDQIIYGTKPGYRIVLDSKDFNLSHALRYSLSNTRNLMTYVQVKLLKTMMFHLFIVTNNILHRIQYKHIIFIYIYIFFRKVHLL